MIKLLLVDDEAAMRRMLRVAFNAAEFQVSEAATGAEALAQFERDRPEVILLDIELPDATGIDICRQMRARTTPADVPVGIILMSGQFKQGSAHTVELAGADHMVGKPFRIQSLRELVRALHLQLRQHDAIDPSENDTQP